MPNFTLTPFTLFLKKFKKAGACFMGLLFFFLLSQTVLAQDIKVLRNGALIPSGSAVAFPAAASTASSITFTIRNDAATALNLTSTPKVVLAGTDAANFSVTTQPTSPLAQNATTTFTVTYTPINKNIHNASLSIASNDPDGAFTLTLKGPGNSLYNLPYPTSETIQATSSTTEAGRTGGKTILITAVSLGTKNNTYWAPTITSTGELQLKLSLDGNTFTDQEVLTFVPGSSNLTNGVAVWTGQTKIQNAISNSVQTVYVRATLTSKKLDNSVYPMINPTTIGLSEQVGGLIKFTTLQDYLQANFFIEASSSPNSGFQPYLDYYDAYPTPPGPLPGQGIGAAYSTISNGFYWDNTTPRLTANNIFAINEGATKTITTASLNATDLEDMPASPEKILFEFPAGATSPLTFNRGTLKLNGTTLTRANKFSLKDIQDGKLSYTHDGSETVNDEFQFSFRDSKGALGVDGPNFVYSFRIQVTPVNDPPVTRDSTFTASIAVPFSATLVAKDPDNTTFTFTKVTNPATGTVTVNSNGNFTYTPAAGATPGQVTFTYRANDGTANSNISTITLNLVNLPPAIVNRTFATREEKAVSGTLAATDPEGSAVTLQVVKQPKEGTVTLNTNGSFTYTPGTARFGTDYFTYRAQDAQGNQSQPATVTIDVLPRLDQGDLLIADKTRIILFDPVTQQDTIISKDNNLVEAQNLFYKKGTSIFVLDKNKGLLKISASTGAQSILTPSTQFSGGGPGPLGITMHKTTGKLVIADATNGIVQVDTTSGVRTSLFTGGSLVFPTGVLLLANGDLIVTDAAAFMGGTSKILRITPGGTQTTLATGGSLKVPVDLDLENDNFILVSDGGSMAGGTDNIIRINLTTGVQQVLTTGGNMGFPSGIGYLSSTNKAYVVNNGNKKLLEINAGTGAQTQLQGKAGFLANPFGLQVISEGPYVLAVAVPANGTYKAPQQLDFTVTFSEPVVVTGVPSFPVTIGSSIKNATYISGSGTVNLLFRYTVITGDEDTDGIVVGASIALNSGTLASTTGVSANSRLNNVAVTTGVLVDAVAPPAPVITAIDTDTGSSPSDKITNDQTLKISGTAEKGSTVTVLRNGISIGTIVANASTGAWTFDHTNTTLAGGQHIFTATATDAVGNVSVASAAFTVTIDIIAPAAPVLTGITTDTGTSNSDKITNDNTLIFAGTAEANAIVTISRTGTGVLGNATAAADGKWTYDYSATALITGSYSFTATATDIAGNIGAASTGFVIEIDLVKPTVVITADKTGTTNTFFTATFTLSEAVAGFTLGDIAVINGTASALATTDNIIFTAKITPTAEGNVTVTLPAGVVTDIAGNTNSVSNTFSIIYDITQPTVVISSTATNPTNLKPFPVKIDFSEIVTGFTISDITVTNGIASNFAGSDKNYTVSITPTADGVVKVNVPAGVVQDAADNTNKAATEFTIIYDSIKPTVVISSTAPNPTNTKPIPVKIEFSEAVTGFALSDFSVTNGTASNLAGSGTSYTVSITPSADGQVLVNIPADMAQDAAGNKNTAATQFSITYDGTRPTVVISSSASSPTTVKPIPVTIEFSENVTGFTLPDIIVTGGTTSGFSGSGQSYSFSLDPTTDGVIKVDVPGNVAVDAAGNLNNAATQFSIIFCIVPTISKQPVDVTKCVGESASFAVTATGTNLTYQWQVNTGNGNFSNISNSTLYTGTTTATLTVNSTTVAMDNYQYRVILTGTCGPLVTSSGASLILNQPPSIDDQPINAAICGGASTSFMVNAAGAGLTYQWQVFTGTGAFTNLTNNTTYGGTKTATLTITGAPLNFNNFQYRLIITGTCAPVIASNPVTLTVYAPLTAGTIDGNQKGCYNTVVSRLNNVTPATGGNNQYIYQWQSSPDGTTWTNITGATAASYLPSALTQTTQFRRSVTSVAGCGPAVFSNVVKVDVYGELKPGEIKEAQTVLYSATPARIFSAAEASGGLSLSYIWEMSSDGTTFSVIPDATSNDYQPGELTETTYFRRVATSENNCGTVASNILKLTVVLREFVDEEIPNVLFVNGSNRNKTWGISHMGITEKITVRVFDKNGQVIFSTNNPANEWNGKYKGKPVPEDTYYYIIENGSKRLSGAVRVIY